MTFHFFLWNLEVHYHVHMLLLLDPILNQSNQVKALTSYSFDIHLILSSSSEVVCPFSFSIKNDMQTSRFPLHVACFAHLIFDLITITIFGEEYKL